jgi:eukaryotic-like serine/threonine-protein kinase
MASDDAAGSPEGVPLGPGAELAGKYRIDRVLGSGGMAAVFEATHLQLGEPVAIKVLHRHVLARHGALERFLREARVAMRLRSEHVARVFDVGAAMDGTPFIVMELLRGSDLATLLSERGPLPAASAVDHLLQACQALVEAHALGVVHRDLKPANLFLCTTFDGMPCVKVLDFGVSKLHGAFQATSSFAVTASAAPDSDRRPLATRTTASGPPRGVSADTPEAFPGSVTLTQAFLGSPQYMAPEQIRSARDVDVRADVWALGVILFELLSGTVPFKAETLSALCDCILERHPIPLRVPGGAAADLETVIATCLAKDPADRYQSVRAFAEAVVQFGSADAQVSLDRIVRMVEAKGLGSTPSRATTSGTPTLVSEENSSPARATVAPAPKREKPKASRWVALAVLGGATAAAAALGLPRWTRTPAPPLKSSATPAEATATVLRAADVASAITPPGLVPANPPDAPSAPARALPAVKGADPTETARRAHPPPRPASSASPAASSASARATSDPALGLDTGELFMERR